MTFRIEDTIYKEYKNAINVYLDDVDEGDKDEVAGMLRGLMVSIEGYSAISGLTNESFKASNPLKLWFATVENAHRFKKCVDYYFDDALLKSLKAKRVYKKR